MERLHLITHAREARRCFDALVETLSAEADEVALHKAAFRPGGASAPTYFFRNYDLWAMPTDGSLLSKSKNRYWNCFGLGGSPRSATSRITVEINHPHSGINKTITGRFLFRDEQYFIGHTGRIGGGVKGFDKSALERVTGHRGHVTEIDGREEQLAFLAPIERPQVFVERLAEYVRLISTARKRLTAQAT